MIFRVVIPGLPGFAHTEAFREVAESVHYGLLALGHDSVLEELTPQQIAYKTDRQTIVFGAHLLDVLAPESIIYNLERTDVPHYRAALLARLKIWENSTVWDYSARNISFWTQNGIPSTHVPIGYAPELTRIISEPEEQNIDVLFYGALSERRLKIIDAIRARGLNVIAFEAPYGKERDAFIARAKIVLNLHYYDSPAVFEIVRVSYLLANKKCVVSEPGEDDDFLRGVYFTDNVPDVCVRLANNARERENLATIGHFLFRKRDVREILQEAIEVKTVNSVNGVADAFHCHWYDSGCWTDLRWQGVLIRKNPFDLMVYQEILWEKRPNVIIETGTQEGGSAKFFRNMLDIIVLAAQMDKEPTIVMSIDINQSQKETLFHPNVNYIEGSSTNPDTLVSVQKLIPKGARVMVVLDSDHTEAHVLRELELYAPLVTEGQYLVVEDGNINGHPVLPQFGPGPLEATEKFMADNRDFEMDRSRERLMVTSNPGGFLLKRQRPKKVPTFCLVVCASSQEKLAEFPIMTAVQETDELVLMVTTNGRFGGLGEIGNRVLDRTRCDVFGMVHADTRFEPGALKTFARTAASGKVTGLVGRAHDQSYQWSKDQVVETAVSTLDGCSIFFPTSIGLRFDAETFDSWHCCIEDVCLSAKVPVVVPPAKADHLSDNWNKNNGPWLKEYWKYRDKLTKKWEGRTFLTT